VNLSFLLSETTESTRRSLDFLYRPLKIGMVLSRAFACNACGTRQRPEQAQPSARGTPRTRLDQPMKMTYSSAILSFAVALSLTSCFGGGGGGGSDGGGSGGNSIGSASVPSTTSSATVGPLGESGSVDLVDASLFPEPSSVDQLMSNAGLATFGIPSYDSGLGLTAADRSRIIGANNLYDLFQIVTGTPVLFQGDGSAGGPPFNGGDGNGDTIPDGGPGLFSNATAYPVRTPLPNTMGSVGRGSSATDQHQFIQIEFPFDLDINSLFDANKGGNSFLGDSVTGLTTVVIQNHFIQRLSSTDTTNVTCPLPATVTGVAVIGGVTSIPNPAGGFTTLHESSIDPTGTNDSFVPEGARALIGASHVLTFIAHESPMLLSATFNPSAVGHIDASGNLILPDPTTGASGGRVLGANAAFPDSVNDFGTTGDSNAARVGFISFLVSSLRTTGGGTVGDAYFHSYEMSQGNVGLDPFAVLNKDPGPGVATSGVDVRTFSRGPAINVLSVGSEPAINVLPIYELGSVINPANLAVLGPVDPAPGSDGINVISTKSRFRIDFDKEVIPNSVGFSRQFTIHSVAGKGIIFPFNGNTRPVKSPAGEFIPTAFASPVAPSVFLAVNQGATVPINDLVTKAGGILFDDMSPIGSLPNGLYPVEYNTLATLPRGVVPCDIYPVNQNNLQAYIIEPLVDLPPGTVVTLGVCRQGLGMTNNGLSATFGLDPTALNAMPSTVQASNQGNFTRSGTEFTQFQDLTPVGLGDNGVAAKQSIIGNHTVIKVNAGPMDLSGKLFFGGTTVANDTKVNGIVQDDSTAGGWNVCRSFQVGTNLERAYVNAPVAPQALIAAFSDGLGVVDLNGTGFNTNLPGGGAENLGSESLLIVSKFLNQQTTNNPTKFNWNNSGSFANGSHVRAFGIISRYVSGGCTCNPTSIESEFATGAAVATGSLTPSPGVNEGSSGYETMVRNSFGNELLTDVSELSQPRDIMFGDFLDTVYTDGENPFSSDALHRTFNTPTQTGVNSNNISDPPIPNPPPMKFPVGLNFTSVQFDQEDLTRAPFLIEASEVFATDTFIQFEDGSGITPGGGVIAMNTFIQLNPTSNASNTSQFDMPHLPNAGFNSPFAGENQKFIKYVQTGPMPKSTTAGSVVLSTLNMAAINSAEPGGLVPPLYQTRQQIGNFLFVTDGLNKKLHAVNSNNMTVIQSLDLPDPFGMGLSSDLDLLFVSNEGDNTVSVIDADPSSGSFMTEIRRVPVGQGPRSVSVSPDNEDVFVLNRLGNSVSIIDLGTQSVRHTLTQSGLNRPNDVCMGLREVSGGIAFQSGTFHGFISNGGGDNVLVYEGGPSGQAGIGFDNILGEVKPNEPLIEGQAILLGMEDPRGISYDPVAPLDAFGGTIGCFVAHQDPVSGRALVTRIAYTKDSSPGQVLFNSQSSAPSFGEKIFAATQQYISPSTGTAFDVALPDYNRELLQTSNFGTNFNLYNAGATLVVIAGLQLPRNAKYPQAGVATGGVVANVARWTPDRVYLASGGKRIDVFDMNNAQLLKTIPTTSDVTRLVSYFEQ
jgi:YVTN family beta-propeller protein